MFQNITNNTDENVKIDKVGIKLEDIIWGSKLCPENQILWDNILNTEPFLSKIDNSLYTYIQNHSHMYLHDFQTAFYMYDLLRTEDYCNLTLPDWTKSVYPTKLKEQALWYFLSHTYTNKLTRLQVGPLWYKIVSFLNNSMSNITAHNVFLISGHELTLVNILNSIGSFDNHTLSYSSCVIFELRQNNMGQFYVRSFLKNEIEWIKIYINNCSFECDILELYANLGSITVSLEEWDAECNASWPPYLGYTIAGIVIILLVLFGLGYYFYRKSTGNFKLIH